MSNRFVVRRVDNAGSTAGKRWTWSVYDRKRAEYAADHDTQKLARARADGLNEAAAQEAEQAATSAMLAAVERANVCLEWYSRDLAAVYTDGAARLLRQGKVVDEVSCDHDVRRAPAAFFRLVKRFEWCVYDFLVGAE